ncbi:MAG: hypothetical protein PSV13_08485 [Lacunisphaera sp.]|nr:hypothetical protein [Lacunisphaera sp.]
MEDLVDAAAATARRMRESPPRREATRRSLTLQPGPDTPLWNELVRQLRPHLRKRGSKAQLARLLALPRQRLQTCLKARTACLDAERTLLLVGWLGFFERGGVLNPSVRPGRPRRNEARSHPGNL